MENIKILKKEKMYCSICEQEHEVELIEEEREINIKGEKIEHKEKLYRCNKYTDENTFETGALWNENLINSLDAYRKKKNLLTSKEIKEIRNKYKITQLEMAQLLGVGDITITRYETKLIQDETYDKIMRLINDNAMLALEYLEQNKNRFKNNERYEEIANNIKIIVFRDTLDYLNKQEIEAKYVNYTKEDIRNGYKVLDIEKIEAIINYIAQNYPNLYKVKLMKILWYIDCIYYNENKKSLTGLVYTHQKMGALPIAYDEIIKLQSVKVEEEIKEYEENCLTSCYHILPNNDYKGKKITEKEKMICDKVINKFKELKTNELVEYMHNEFAYKNTSTGEVIDFSYAQFIIL